MIFADPARLPAMQYAYLSSAQGVQIQRTEAWDTLAMKYRAFLDFGAGWLDGAAHTSIPGPDMATVAEQLTEARAAYHRLMIGEALVSITDQNGERIEYSRTTAPRLAAYIADLERLSAGQSRPASITFRTSKGLT